MIPAGRNSHADLLRLFSLVAAEEQGRMADFCGFEFQFGPISLEAVLPVSPDMVKTAEVPGKPESPASSVGDAQHGTFRLLVPEQCKLLDAPADLAQHWLLNLPPIEAGEWRTPDPPRPFRQRSH